jgi:hypothetical protein
MSAPEKVTSADLAEQALQRTTVPAAYGHAAYREERDAAAHLDHEEGDEH